ncbi:RNA-binding cell elongation regulator Jag/EloR [Alkalicoccobacillus porphyridii]|uniref:RNA-binding protein KhpB n=1 Tax=Alkalicoccobacillus porphyridii TaxID=2597270 RepID=A0A554A1G9_9BACI|nr:RNA-binding cell elongation regulator Jag/EloR [Alkalicoccobacillus porphyridii]TSB47537.1 protein jag [Alkalicoccobacillus porphyridii]
MLKVTKVKASGKTTEEAVKNAANELNVPQDRVHFEVLEEAKKGFLGLIGVKNATIEAYVLPDPEEEAYEFLTQTMKEMGIPATIDKQTTNEGVSLSVACEQERDTARLIGKRGQTLDSLEYLVGLAANRRHTKNVNFLVDAGGYRAKRIQSLRELAIRVAKKAQEQQEEIPLEPMSARERKIVHQMLYNQEGVMTYSKGKGTHRHVIVKKST